MMPFHEFEDGGLLIASLRNKLLIDALLSGLKEIEELFQFPGVAGHMQKSMQLATSIARRAPSGDISNLAMRLRLALQQAKSRVS